MATLDSEGNYIHIVSQTSADHPYKIDAWLLKDDTNVEVDRKGRVYITSHGKNYYFSKDEITRPSGSGITIENYLKILKTLFNPLTGKLNSYGASSVEEDNAITVGNAVYGFIPANFRTFTQGGGTATTEANYFKVTSGTTLNDYGTIRSFRSLNYKTAQGARVRFSALFGEPQENSWSGVGAFNIGDELSFGYNGLNFGVWHRYNGKAEIQELQLTVGASGAETATVTINSTVYNIPITSGTVQFNAYQIAEYLNSNATAFVAEQLNDTVIIDFLSDGDKTGTFSFSSTGTATGSWTQLTQGVTKTSDHYSLDEWDSPYGYVGFDPSKGNNYEIVYQNGYGNLQFYIEDPNTNIYKLVHTIKIANNFTVPNLYNPSLHIGLYATCLGNSTNVSVNCAYIGGFVSGKLRRTRNPRSEENTKSIDTTLTNILTIRNSRTYNGLANQIEFDPLYLTIADDGLKSAIFKIITNATVAGPTNFQPIGTNLASQIDTTGGAVTGGRVLATFTVAKGGSLPIDLTSFVIRQPPGLTLTIAGQMDSGSASDLTATLTWYEDV